MDEFPRSLHVQIDEHDIRHEQYAQRAMLSLEHDIGPALYSPEGETNKPVFPPIPLLQPSIRNPELSSVSLNSLCRAMSLEINGYVDWFRCWWDYGDVDAFFLGSGYSCQRKDVTAPSPILVSQEQFGRSMEVHRLLEQNTGLDLCIARWRRSKRPTTQEEQLIELRITLELLFLPDMDQEMSYRLATRGAWLLGETFKERETYFGILRDAYTSASKFVHGGTPNKDRDELARVIGEAQDSCRKVILRIVEAGMMPNWPEVVLGKEFCRAPDQDHISSADGHSSD